MIVEGQRADLDRVMVLFNLPQGAAINSVHVWDGPTRILQLDGLDVTGNHAGGLDADNTFPVNHPGILWGVGISLLVSTVQNADIYFATTGADFQHNI